MAETKEKEPDKKKSAETEKKGVDKKKMRKWIGIAVILFVCSSFIHPISWSGGGNAIDPEDVGVLTLTTGNNPGVQIELDPNENCAQSMVTQGVEWEQMINGRWVYRMPVGQPRIDLVDPDSIGVMTNMAFRIVEGQAVQTAKLAYVKYRKATPPRGWFKAATQNQ